MLSSNCLNVVLGVLNLLYMFSKRSNFISRLASERRVSLLSRLTYLAEVNFSVVVIVLCSRHISHVCLFFYTFLELGRQGEWIRPGRMLQRSPAVGMFVSSHNF